jgi:2'-hydroxyisoflavone reductase
VRILVLGGTAFVGRAIVEDALRSGAEVTLFGRGQTGTSLFPG